MNSIPYADVDGEVGLPARSKSGTLDGRDSESLAGFSLDDSLSMMLRRALQIAGDMFQGEEGYTLRQAEVLAAVAASEGASQSDLVRSTGVDRSTMAELLKRMEQKGLLSRAAAKGDARAKSVSLTPQGWRVLAVAAPRMQEVNERMLEAIPRKKRDAFVSVLTMLSQPAGDAPVEAAHAPPARVRKAATSKKAKKKGGKTAKARKKGK